MLSREEIEQIAAEGRDAFEMGMEIRHCPYPNCSTERETWARGFQNAAYGASMCQLHKISS